MYVYARECVCGFIFSRLHDGIIVSNCLISCVLNYTFIYKNIITVGLLTHTNSGVILYVCTWHSNNKDTLLGFFIYLWLK